jgi:hypothetical protein
MTNINTFQGNVGIGTDNPDEKLEVVQGGSIKLSGDYINSTAKLYIDRVGDATWSTSGDYDAFRFFETRNTSASEYFNAVKIGASGIAIGYDPPLYSRAGVDSLICSGRVGIGTITPQDVTHIYKNGGNGDHGLLIEQNNSGTGSAYLKFGVGHASESTAGLSKAGIFFKRAETNGRGDLVFCVDNADDTNDVDTSNHALTIYRDRNVGIGTLAPGCDLHILGSSGEMLRATDGTRTFWMGCDENHPWIGTSTNHALRVTTNGVTRMTIAEGGHIGIGNTGLSGVSLTVAGKIQAGSTTTSNNTAVIAGGGDTARVARNNYLNINLDFQFARGFHIVSFGYISFYDGNIVNTQAINVSQYNGPYRTELAGSQSYIQISTLSTDTLRFRGVNLPAGYNDWALNHWYGGYVF